PARKRPVVVITRASGAAAAYVDAEELRADLAGLADVAEITGAEASWAFSQAVPDQCQVYGGASRVYPIGDDWTADPYLSPLRFAYGPSDKVKVTRQLISDALSMAARGGLTLGSGTEAPCVVTGEVQGVIGDRALVTIPGVQMGGTLWPELVLPDLAAERLFCKGMRVVGTFDPESRRIDVTGMRRSAVDALSGYRDGDTVLARVVGVDGGGCDVELFPGEVRRVGAEDIAEDGATVADLVAAGDVVALWFGEPEAGQWLLSMLDAADPAEAVPAPSVLDGGPPWLVTVDKAEPAGDDEAPEGAEESTGLTPEQQREKALIIKRLRRAENEIEELTLQLQESRKRLRAAQKRLKRRQGAVTAVDRLFEGDADQLDFEIGAAWARMIPPAQKHELRLRPHRFGDHFLATMAEVEGIARDKVVEVIVHVLTGLDAELDSRGRYQLRTGEGGDNPARTRNGGEVCWRVSLQANTPGARRLHYWTCHDWTIELSSIRVHDDYRP
ncbi:hypothetical protein ACFQ06_15960, partial [Tessaracoccus lubricantis]